MSAFDIDAVPTVEADDALTPREIRVCAGCGLPEDRWRENRGAGYDETGQTYCCRGCADQTGCTCRS